MNINLNKFLQITLLENTTIEPTESGITFAELICGDNSRVYKQQFINYIKAPQNSKDKNKLTKTKFAEENPKLAEKFNILIQHLSALESAINNFDAIFFLCCLNNELTTSSKKAQTLLYWILEQFITWKQRPKFYNVEEIKISLIYFINRVKPELNSYIRDMALHACAPQRFANIKDIKKFKVDASRTFALA